MELKTICVTYGRKLNMGDYNSVHSEISLFAELDEGEDEASGAESLRQMARHQVMLELSRVDQRIAAKVEGIFAGLPVILQKKLDGSKYTGDKEFDADEDFDFAAADSDHSYRYS